jgi:hypothetical protein
VDRATDAFGVAGATTEFGERIDDRIDNSSQCRRGAALTPKRTPRRLVGDHTSLSAFFSAGKMSAHGIA